jgi:microcystin-dependent protein
VRVRAGAAISLAAVAVVVALSGCAGISRDDLERRLREIKGGAVPPGTVVAFAGEQLPAGWLWCDGTEYDIARYPALAAAIGKAHGTSDPAVRFRVPDYRGRFLRGVDAGAQRDPDAARRAPMAVGGNRGDSVGSVQGDAFAAHTHDIGKSAGSHPEGIERVQAGNPDLARGVVRSSTTGGSETRPQNASVKWIVRAL